MTGAGYVYNKASHQFLPLYGGQPLDYVQPPAPNAPTALGHSAVVADGFTITWSAPTGGAGVKGYRVFLNGVQVGSDLPSTQLSLTVSGLAGGTYAVTVAAFNDSGQGPSATDSVTVTGPVAGVPDPPTGVSHSALVADGWTTSWSAPVTGAAVTGYRVFINSIKYGGDLARTARSVDITGQAPGNYSVTVKAFNTSGASAPSAADVVTLGATAPPGLTAGKVLTGWYASRSSHNNDIDHAAVIMDPRNDSIAPGAWWQGSGDFAKTIPGGLFRKQTPVRKEFEGNQITNASLLANLADADAGGWYLIQCSKVQNDSWAGMARGDFDDILQGYTDIVKARIAAGKRSFMYNHHHEPHGDYNGTTRTTTLWASMHIHCSYFFAGWRNPTNPGAITPGTPGAVYTPSEDVRAGISYGCIPNGFLLTGGKTATDEFRELTPDTLIAAFNANNGIVAADIYDGRTVGIRTHDRINALAQYCRDHGIKWSGVAETGTYDATSIAQLWQAVKANVDVLRFVVYWDSGIGQVPSGATDWRLLPNGYPSDNLAGASGPFDGPGTAVTESLLLYWRDTAVVEAEAM